MQKNQTNDRIALIEHFEQEDKHILIIEFANGGSLFDMINYRISTLMGPCPEELAQLITRKLA